MLKLEINLNRTFSNYFFFFKHYFNFKFSNEKVINIKKNGIIILYIFVIKFLIIM